MTTATTGTTRFNLGDEQRDLLEVAERVSRDRYGGEAQEWDSKRESLPTAERRFLADLGFLGITISEEFGGSGRPVIDALLVIEALAKGSMAASWPVFEATTGPVRVVELFGTQEQKERFIPPVIAGESTIAVSISEADAGSAATDLAIKARIEGDEVVINGSKRWCSGAGHAEQYLVYVRLGDEPGARGIGAVIVDLDTPGLTFGPRENLMGWRTVHSADMFFDDVRIPVENLVIEKGGFNKLFTAFSIERLGNATHSLAIGQFCLDRCAAYVREREQFGRPIAEFQMVQAALADMVMQVDAARLLIYRAADNAGTAPPQPLEASIAKCYANEMAKRVSDIAIQLHGGYGYSAEYDVERAHRDAHGWALAGGTPNIQRMRIAGEFLGMRFNQRPAVV